MAEQIPYGVATSLINKLASVAFVEIGRIYGVSDKLKDLKETLESIHIVLSDAEQKQSADPVIKHWISRFKEVLHDADDLLDGLAIKDLRCKVDGGSKAASKRGGSQRVNIDDLNGKKTLLSLLISEFRSHESILQNVEFCRSSKFAYFLELCAIIIQKL